MPIKRVLIVDDDPLSREFLTEAVRTLGYQSEPVDNGNTALDRLRASSFDLVLTDMRMPGMDGMDLVRRLSSEFVDLPVVLVTAHGTIESAVQAMRLGARDFLVKPINPDALAMVIERVDHTSTLERENEYLRSEMAAAQGPKVIAESPTMLATLDSAARLAGSKGTVLITGESGTGKERVAHHIHENSPRRDRPFIRVNCAALSEQLLESELFGHERGAFTGAFKTRAGRFELADTGTLLLDEIGEISSSLQAKLLRVLEEEEFERVGGSSTLKVDVRVIATTNRDLPAEVRKGDFREDLYYRLHVLPIELAPLRDREEDILPLVQHFARYYADQNGFPVPNITPEAEHRLTEWMWPGNVRELENVVQRAVVLGQGATISVAELHFGPSGDPLEPSLPRDEHGNPDLSALLANRKISDIEREAILATLERTGGNKTEAARRLGVTARTLSNKMKLWRQLGLVA